MTPFLKEYTGTGAFVALESAQTDPHNATGSKPMNFVGTLQATGGTVLINVGLVTGTSLLDGQIWDVKMPTDLSQLQIKGNTFVLKALGHLTDQ